MTTKKLIIWTGIIVGCLGLWFVLFFSGKQIHLENGPMENVQLAGLAVATAFFWRHGVVARPET